MGEKINVRTYKGTRDFLPEQMVKRNYVIDLIKKAFENFGFEPLETPAMELMEILGGKYGDEGDKLLYNFEDRGGRKVGLRYDLTVPLARVVAMHQQIIKPFKRYQIQPVWRADKPQKGRFREFYQCDIDVIGSNSLMADAEVLAAIVQAFDFLGFRNVITKINNRKILKGMIEASGIAADKEIEVIRIIDKIDKIGIEGIIKEFSLNDLPENSTKKLMDFLNFSGNTKETIEHAAKFLEQSPIGLEGIEEMKQLFAFIENSEIDESKYKFDLYLARGLDYYTGPIFESVFKDVKIGSIAGGGRYDNLIGLFKGENIPAVGIAIGLERIITVMDELNMFPAELNSTVQVLVTVFNDETRQHSQYLANLLRKNGIKTDLYLGKPKLRGQLGYAADKKIPLVIIAGPDEIVAKMVTLKNMVTKEQFNIEEANLIEKIKEITKQ